MRLSATPRIGRSDGLDVGAVPGVGRGRPPRCRATMRHRAGQVGVGVGAPASTRAATMRMPRVAEPADDVRRSGRAASGTAKIVPALARMTFGLARSVRGEAAMTRVGPGAVGAAQHGAEVARLLDALDDDDQRSVGQAQVVERERRGADDRDEPLGPVAERELGEGGLGRRGDRDAGRRAARRARRGRPRRRAAARRRTPRRPRRPASSARRSSRAPSTSVRPVASRSRRSRSRAAALIRGFDGLASVGRGRPSPS